MSAKIANTLSNQNKPPSILFVEEIIINSGVERYGYDK